MSYKRLTDEELEEITKVFSVDEKAMVYRALLELAELRQAAEPEEVKPLPEDYWKSAQ